MKICELLDKVSSTQVEDSKLYFITRKLGDGIKKTTKMMNKFVFKVYQVDIDDQIRKYLFDYTEKQLEYVIKKNLEMTDYDVISDDTECIFKYSMKNSTMPFSDVVHKHLKSIPPKIISIEDIISGSDKEELWAYCIGFNDVENADWIYTFRKFQSGKVAVDEKDNQTVLGKVIRSLFNTQSKKLELLKGETVTLDKQIDCIYYNDIFYIIKKGNFEQIICLQEEFKSEAKQVVSKMQETSMITGLDMLEAEIDKNPAIHKKLARIAQLGNIQSMSPKDIKRMQEVCKKRNLNLKVEHGKLAIKEKEDIETILKMFADYYKTGDVTGEAYGTYSGKKIE